MSEAFPGPHTAQVLKSAQEGGAHGSLEMMRGPSSGACLGNRSSQPQGNGQLSASGSPVPSSPGLETLHGVMLNKVQIPSQGTAGGKHSFLPRAPSSCSSSVATTLVSCSRL